MNWKRMLIATLTKSKYQAFINDTKEPKQARVRLWTKEILPLLQQSEYWSKQLPSAELHDFPITTYETYEASLLAAQHQQMQPLNNEPLIFWSETSGTSGVRKFFPITQTFQTQFQRTMSPFIYNLTQRFSHFFKEKMLYLVTVDANKTTPGGIPAGWISYYNYRNLPSFIKRFYAMPAEVFADQQLFRQWGGLYALASDLSAIFAVTPMMINDFYERCVQQFSDHLPYLLGEKALPAGLPALKISKRRQNYLKRIANQPHTFKQLWPGLQFACCWTSGLCEYPAQQLHQLMGKEVALVDGTYSATEGWLTVALETEQPGGYLHPGAHIVEFIEEGQEIDKAHLVQAWELEVGKKYEVFLTTAMGFVRYQLKDVVLCTGFLNQSPRLEFCYKTQLLKLESCALTGQELQQMLKEVGFNMQPHWFFARNHLGNCIVLVTDDRATISDTALRELHQALIGISPTYAHSSEHGEVVPMVLWQVAKEELLKDAHAQTKPTLISPKVIKEA